MKALFFNTHGDADVLDYGDLPDPEPGEGEARIRVDAVGLNHLDIWVRRGWAGLQLPLPHIGGSDIVGRIDSIRGSHTLAEGDRVLIDPALITTEDEWTRRGEHSLSPGYRILGEHCAGGFAEYVTVPLRNIHAAPEDVEDAPLAASLLVGTTCWRMLFTQGRLQPGETILVVGAGGGINSLSISIAAQIGCRVIALTSTSEKEKKAKEQGAHVVINYTSTPDWHKAVLQETRGRGVDLVVDNVGQATIQKSLKAASRGGRIVTVGNTSGYDISFDNRLLFAKQLSLIGSTMGSAQDFHSARRFIHRHRLYPPIDTIAPLSEGIAQLKRLESGEQFGKIVLTP